MPHRHIFLSLHPDKKIPDCGNNYGNFRPVFPHKAAFFKHNAHAIRYFHKISFNYRFRSHYYWSGLRI